MYMYIYIYIHMCIQTYIFSPRQVAPFWQGITYLEAFRVESLRCRVQGSTVGQRGASPSQTRSPPQDLV